MMSIHELGPGRLLLVFSNGRQEFIYQTVDLRDPTGPKFRSARGSFSLLHASGGRVWHLFTPARGDGTDNPGVMVNGVR